MENDQDDPEFEARFQKMLDGIPPTPKKGDKISRRENAESVARCLRGDLSNREAVSEEELQNALEWMDAREEERKNEQTVLLFGCLGVLVVLVAVLYFILVV